MRGGVHKAAEMHSVERFDIRVQGLASWNNDINLRLRIVSIADCTNAAAGVAASPAAAGPPIIIVGNGEPTAF